MMWGIIMRQINTIFFDMGNTLLDFHKGMTDIEKDRLGLQAMADYLSRYGPVTADDLEQNFKKPWYETCRLRPTTLQEYPVEEHLNRYLEPYGTKLELPECIEVMDRYHTEYRHQVVTEEKLDQTLSELKSKGYKIGVISNCYLYDEIMIRHFQHAGIHEYIDSFIFSYYLRVRKPRKEIFLAALKRLQTVPEKSIMVGDLLEADVAGAQAVGMKAVWYNPTGEENNTQIKPDYVVGSLREVAQLRARK